MLTLIGFGLALTFSMPAMREMVGIGGSLKGQPPTPEQGMRMGFLAARIQRFGQMTAGLLILAVGAMAVARYV